MSRSCDLIKNSGRIVGNNVSKSNRKTKRTFLPNLVTKTLLSDTLNSKFVLTIKNRTYRTIIKHGGLDQFLAKLKSGKLTQEAKSIRNKVLKKNPELYNAKNKQKTTAK
jgi:large subunit ribosomal protein L28